MASWIPLLWGFLRLITAIASIVVLAISGITIVEREIKDLSCKVEEVGYTASMLNTIWKTKSEIPLWKLNFCNTTEIINTYGKQPVSQYVDVSTDEAAWTSLYVLASLATFQFMIWCWLLIYGVFRVSKWIFQLCLRRRRRCQLVKRQQQTEQKADDGEFAWENELVSYDEVMGEADTEATDEKVKEMDKAETHEEVNVDESKSGNGRQNDNSTPVEMELHDTQENMPHPSCDLSQATITVSVQDPLLHDKRDANVQEKERQNDIPISPVTKPIQRTQSRCTQTTISLGIDEQVINSMRINVQETAPVPEITSEEQGVLPRMDPDGEEQADHDIQPGKAETAHKLTDLVISTESCGQIPAAATDPDQVVKDEAAEMEHDHIEAVQLAEENEHGEDMSGESDEDDSSEDESEDDSSLDSAHEDQERDYSQEQDQKLREVDDDILVCVGVGNAEEIQIHTEPEFKPNVLRLSGPARDVRQFINDKRRIKALVCRQQALVSIGTGTDTDDELDERVDSDDEAIVNVGNREEEMAIQEKHAGEERHSVYEQSPLQERVLHSTHNPHRLSLSGPAKDVRQFLCDKRRIASILRHHEIIKAGNLTQDDVAKQMHLLQNDIQQNDFGENELQVYISHFHHQLKDKRRVIMPPMLIAQPNTDLSSLTSTPDSDLAVQSDTMIVDFERIQCGAEFSKQKEHLNFTAKQGLVAEIPYNEQRKLISGTLIQNNSGEQTEPKNPVTPLDNTLKQLQLEQEDLSSKIGDDEMVNESELKKLPAQSQEAESIIRMSDDSQGRDTNYDAERVTHSKSHSAIDNTVEDLAVIMVLLNNKVKTGNVGLMHGDIKHKDFRRREFHVARVNYLQRPGSNMNAIKPIKDNPPSTTLIEKDGSEKMGPKIRSKSLDTIHRLPQLEQQDIHEKIKDWEMWNESELNKTPLQSMESGSISRMSDEKGHVTNYDAETDPRSSSQTDTLSAHSHQPSIQDQKIFSKDVTAMYPDMAPPVRDVEDRGKSSFHPLDDTCISSKELTSVVSNVDSSHDILKDRGKSGSSLDESNGFSGSTIKKDDIAIASCDIKKDDMKSQSPSVNKTNGISIIVKESDATPHYDILKDRRSSQSPPMSDNKAAEKTQSPIIEDSNGFSMIGLTKKQDATTYDVLKNREQSQSPQYEETNGSSKPTYDSVKDQGQSQSLPPSDPNTFLNNANSKDKSSSKVPDMHASLTQTSANDRAPNNAETNKPSIDHADLTHNSSEDPSASLSNVKEMLPTCDPGEEECELSNSNIAYDINMICTGGEGLSTCSRARYPCEKPLVIPRSIRIRNTLEAYRTKSAEKVIMKEIKRPSLKPTKQRFQVRPWSPLVDRNVVHSTGPDMPTHGTVKSRILSFQTMSKDTRSKTHSPPHMKIIAASVKDNDLSPSGNVKKKLNAIEIMTEVQQVKIPDLSVDDMKIPFTKALASFTDRDTSQSISKVSNKEKQMTCVDNTAASSNVPSDIVKISYLASNENPSTTSRKELSRTYSECSDDKMTSEIMKVDSQTPLSLTNTKHSFDTVISQTSHKLESESVTSSPLPRDSGIAYLPHLAESKWPSDQADITPYSSTMDKEQMSLSTYENNITYSQPFQDATDSDKGSEVVSNITRPKMPSPTISSIKKHDVLISGTGRIKTVTFGAVSTEGKLISSCVTEISSSITDSSVSEQSFSDMGVGLVTGTPACNHINDTPLSKTTERDKYDMNTLVSPFPSSEMGKDGLRHPSCEKEFGTITMTLCNDVKSTEDVFDNNIDKSIVPQSEMLNRELKNDYSSLVTPTSTEKEDSEIPSGMTVRDAPGQDQPIVDKDITSESHQTNYMPSHDHSPAFKKPPTSIESYNLLATSTDPCRYAMSFDVTTVRPASPVSMFIKSFTSMKQLHATQEMKQTSVDRATNSPDGTPQITQEEKPDKAIFYTNTIKKLPEKPTPTITKTSKIQTIPAITTQVKRVSTEIKETKPERTAFQKRIEVFSNNLIPGNVQECSNDSAIHDHANQERSKPSRRTMTCADVLRCPETTNTSPTKKFLKNILKENLSSSIPKRSSSPDHTGSVKDRILLIEKEDYTAFAAATAVAAMSTDQEAYPNEFNRPSLQNHEILRELDGLRHTNPVKHVSRDISIKKMHITRKNESKERMSEQQQNDVADELDQLRNRKKISHITDDKPGDDHDEHPDIDDGDLSAEDNAYTETSNIEHAELLDNNDPCSLSTDLPCLAVPPHDDSCTKHNDTHPGVDDTKRVAESESSTIINNAPGIGNKNESCSILHELTIIDDWVLSNGYNKGTIHHKDVIIGQDEIQVSDDHDIICDDPPVIDEECSHHSNEDNHNDIIDEPPVMDKDECSGHSNENNHNETIDELPVTEEGELEAEDGKDINRNEHQCGKPVVFYNLCVTLNDIDIGSAAAPDEDPVDIGSNVVPDKDLADIGSAAVPDEDPADIGSNVVPDKDLADIGCAAFPDEDLVNIGSNVVPDEDKLGSIFNDLPGSSTDPLIMEHDRDARNSGEIIPQMN